MDDRMKPGGGGRFAKLVAQGVPPGAAANSGRRKYGKQRFQRMAARGRVRAARRSSR